MTKRVKLPLVVALLAGIVCGALVRPIWPQTPTSRPPGVAEHEWWVISDSAGIEVIDGPIVTTSPTLAIAGSATDGARGRLWLLAGGTFWVPVELMNQARLSPLH
jgi:hypothetical protein